jgi:predicted PurR-regulated permease PerM
MNKRGQKEVGLIIEAFVSIIFLVFTIPIFLQLSSLTNAPQQPSTINNTALEQAENLSQQLEICQKNFEDLNKSILTKDDLSSLTNAINQINQNVITIYESNQNYIANYFSLTITLSIAFTLTLSFGLLTLLDWTVFKFELARGFFRAVKKRFSKEEVKKEAS